MSILYFHFERHTWLHQHIVYSLIFYSLIQFAVSSSQSKPSLTNAAKAGNAMNSIKKAVAIKDGSEEAKPLVANSNGR